MVGRSNSATPNRHDLPVKISEKYRFSDDVTAGKASKKYSDVFDNHSPPVRTERRKPSSQEQHKSPQRASTSNSFARSRSPSRPRMMSHPAESSSGQRNIPMSKFELFKSKTPEKMSRQGISQGVTTRPSTRPVTASPSRKMTFESPTRKAIALPSRKVMASLSRRTTASPSKKKFDESPTRKANAYPTRKVMSSPSRRSTASPRRKAAKSPGRKASFSPRRHLAMSPGRKSSGEVRPSSKVYHNSHQDSIKGMSKIQFSIVPVKTLISHSMTSSVIHIVFTFLFLSTRKCISCIILRLQLTCFNDEKIIIAA